jgi:hypothetical protein
MVMFGLDMSSWALIICAIIAVLAIAGAGASGAAWRRADQEGLAKPGVSQYAKSAATMGVGVMAILGGIFVILLVASAVWSMMYGVGVFLSIIGLVSFLFIVSRIFLAGRK